MRSEDCRRRRASDNALPSPNALGPSRYVPSDTITKSAAARPRRSAAILLFGAANSLLRLARLTGFGLAHKASRRWITRVTDCGELELRAGLRVDKLAFTGARTRISPSTGGGA